MCSVQLKNILRYENLENEFNDAEEFIIDGDSLLLSVVNDQNFNMIYGGHSLQLVYIVERKLKLFVQKGPRFTILFAKLLNRLLWNRCVAMQLFREVLIYHLSLNLNYNVIRERTDFNQYLNDTKPSMIILSYQGLKLFRSKLFHLSDAEMKKIKHFLFERIGYYLKLGMNISLIETVHLTRTGLFGNIIMSQPSQLQTKRKSVKPADTLNVTNVKKDSDKMKSNEPKENRKFTFSFTGYPDIYNQSITIQLEAGIEIFQCLQKQYLEISKDLVKVYFMYIVIKEKIPLRHRSYGASSNVSLPENIFSIFQKSLLHVWCQTEQKNDSKLVDIWSGNLYVKVLETLLECYDSDKNIDENSRTMLLYQNILNTFAKAIAVEFEPFPVIDLNVEVRKFYKINHGNDKLFDPSPESMQILKIDSELQTIYAGELYNELDVVGVQEDLDFHIKSEFLDEYHWHNKKSLIDYDVLKTIMVQKKKELKNCAYKKKVQRDKAKLALAKHRESEFISGSDRKIFIPSVKPKGDKKKNMQEEGRK